MKLLFFQIIKLSNSFFNSRFADLGVFANTSELIYLSFFRKHTWEESYIFNLYKGKGDALVRGNYRCLKLLEHVMKVLERIVETQIRSSIKIDDMQFGFRPGRGTTDAIFIVRQLQEKFLAKKKNLYLAFVDLEKAFDRVPRQVLWWAMRKLGIDEWIVQLVQAMYCEVRSKVRVDNCFSESFIVNVGVHQGSVLSPLLFIIVLEALSQEFRTGSPWELLYADDLAIIAETIEELSQKLDAWKVNLEKKGLRVNMKKTKIMFSGVNMDTLIDTGANPCGVCRSGVGKNSIFCPGCKHWVHKCSGIRGRLVEDEDFQCNRCCGLARPIDGRPCDSITLGGHTLKVVDTFCDLGDTISAGGGCKHGAIARARSAWGKFWELLPLLTNCYINIMTRGNIFNVCVRSVLLYGSECWAMRKEHKARLERNDRAVLRWICGVKISDRVSVDSLYQRLGIAPLTTLLRSRRLRWFGHVSRSDGWINQCCNLDARGKRGKGRPRKSWDDVIMDDLNSSNLNKESALDRVTWRSVVKSATKTSNPCFKERR